MSCPGGLTRLCCGQAGLLVNADDVPRGVTERGDHLPRMGIDWLYDLTARRDDRLDRRGGAGGHDVNHQTGLGRRRPTEDPGAADLVDGVVERSHHVASLSDLPP